MTYDQVKQRLVEEFGLKTEKKECPILRAEDEFELLRTLYCSSKMVFDHERHRIELALILQLAGITGNRPTALLGLQYKDINVTLLQVNGNIRVLVEFKFVNTKSYLGGKEA